MAVPRFFYPRLGTDFSSAFELPTDEALHASRVLRLQTGAGIELFDGLGNRAKAAVISSDKRSVRVECVSMLEFFPNELEPSLIVGVSMPKSDRQRSVIEKVVELGVNGILPITTERSVAVANDKAIERLKRQSIEACKQSSRNRLPLVFPSVPIDTLYNERSVHAALHSLERTSRHRMDVSQTESDPSFLPRTGSTLAVTAQPGTSTTACNRFVMHPYNVGEKKPPMSSKELQKPTCVLVGPEGGFTDSEVSQLLQSGWIGVGIGTRIMRVETAVAAVATWISLQQSTPEFFRA